MEACPAARAGPRRRAAPSDDGIAAEAKRECGALRRRSVAGIGPRGGALRRGGGAARSRARRVGRECGGGVGQRERGPVIPRHARGGCEAAQRRAVAHRAAGPVSRPPCAPRRAGRQRRPCRAPPPPLLPTNCARSSCGPVPNPEPPPRRAVSNGRPSPLAALDGHGGRRRRSRTSEREPQPWAARPSGSVLDGRRARRRFRGSEGRG